MKANIYDKRRILLEKILAEDHIPYLSGRPSRDLVINANDMLDIKIALNTSSTVEDLVGKL